MNWLITGISSGLGKALCECLLDKGEYVIGTFRREEEVAAFNQKWQDKALAIQLDLSDQGSILRVVESLKGVEINVLINNAGIGIVGAVEECSIEEIRHVIEVNFMGLTLLTQRVLPLMRERRSGNIVMISSHAGIKSFAGFGIYNASKYALEGMTEALELEVKDLGIKVCLVQPGPFRTNFAGSSLIEAEEIIEDYKETAGAFRDKLKSVHHKQEGHPYKAAHAIIDHVMSGSPTLRLALGKVPLTTIQMKIDALQADLDRNRAISESAIYED